MSAATPLRALTIRQPYADAIVHVNHPTWGRKLIENRTWAAPKEHIGTRIMIHAGKTADRRALDAGVLPGPDARGAIIATATLTGCHFDVLTCLPHRGSRGCGPWAQREVFHWVLDDIQALPTPVPAKGVLKLWTPPEAVQQAVRDQQATVLLAAAGILDDGAPAEVNLVREFVGDESAAAIDGALAVLMRASAAALQHGAVVLATPRLLTEAHRLTTAHAASAELADAEPGGAA